MNVMGKPIKLPLPSQNKLLRMLFPSWRFSDNITRSDWSQAVIDQRLLYVLGSIAPPIILSSSVYSAKLIAANSSRYKPQDSASRESEVTRLLSEGITQGSTSTRRAQPIVIRDVPKSRLLIDYSQTIIRHTSKDAFPFSKIQDLQDHATENTVFQKLS